MSAVDQNVVGFQATGGVANGGSTNMTTSATVAAGALIVVLAGCFVSGGTGTLTISGSGLSWSQATTGGTGNIDLFLWYALAASGLSSGSTITAALGGGTGGDITFGASSYTGLDVSGGVLGFNSATATTNANWSTGSVSGSGALIGGAWADGTLSTSTPTAPAVEQLDQNSGTTNEQVTIVSKLGVTGSNSLAGTWTNALTNVGVCALFTETSGAVNVFRPHRMPLGV